MSQLESKDGLFSTAATAYSALNDLKVGGKETMCQVWKLHIPPKVKVFI